MLVIFASHNGASRHLKSMLASMQSVHTPDEGIAFVAVDSASTDNTRDLLSRAEAELPLTALAAPAPGKNIALNHALDRVQEQLDRHSLVVFTDDDIHAHPDWLRELEAASWSTPQANIFGGRIDPIFPHELDPEICALEDRFDVLFARNVRSEGHCRAVDVFGPNMAVRPECLKPSVRFDPAIGPNAARVFAMGSETELLLRLERAGARAFHAPRARVDHLIVAEELSPRAIVERARRHGAGFAQMYRQTSSPAWLGTPAWMLRGYIARHIDLLCTHMAGSKARRLRSRYDRAWISGAVAHFRRLHRASL
jgi:glycosyltransferase involved in cell wall biosynthesis